MKKTIIAFAIAFFTWHVGAMAQEMLKLKAKDDEKSKQQFELEKDHALLSININDAYGDLATKEGVKDAIPLDNVTQDEIEDLLDDENYEYILRVHRAYNQGADANPVVIRGLSEQERKRRAEIEARSWQYRAEIFRADALSEAWNYLKAAHYLNIPELIEKYALKIAIALLSDASMRLLQTNDQKHIKMIRTINQNRLFADLILHYIPEVWALKHTLEGHTNDVNSASFSPDGSKIVTASGDGTAKIWNVQTGVCEHTYEHMRGGHRRWIDSALFSPDGRKIVTAGDDIAAKIWNADTGRLEHTLSGHHDTVFSASFSPDSSKVVTISGDGTAKIWNAATGELERTLRGHGGIVLLSASFSPDGSKIVTTAGGKARIWNAQTGVGEHALVGESGRVNLRSFSPDGSKIVAASEGHTARIWDVDTGALEHALTGHIKMVTSASFSPDGSKIVTASDDNTAKIWNATTGESERTLTGHTDWVISASFSPDSSKIVTASRDTTAKIWSVVDRGILKHPLTGHKDWVISALFSPDGSKIVTASRDNTAKIWAPLPARTMEQALFLQYLQFIKNHGGQPGWVSGWGRTVMDSYDSDEKALIKKTFPKVLMQQSVMQTIGSYLGFGSSSSSSNNNNNNE